MELWWLSGVWVVARRLQVVVGGAGLLSGAEGMVMRVLHDAGVDETVGHRREVLVALEVRM